MDLPSPKETSPSESVIETMGKITPQTVGDTAVLDDPQPKYNRQISPKVLSKTTSLSTCIPECPEAIPLSGVETSHEAELMQVSYFLY